MASETGWNEGEDVQKAIARLCVYGCDILGNLKSTIDILFIFIILYLTVYI